MKDSFTVKIMIRTLFLMGFLLSNFTASSAVAGKLSAKEIIKKVKKKYGEMTSLQADFEQVFFWELAGDTQTVSGKIYLKQGNNYRIDTDNQSIVTDGTTVWTYSKSNDQVIIDLVSDSEENPLPKDLLFRYSEDYEARLVGEEKLDGRKVHVIDMDPKDEDGLVLSMRIWVDASDWLTRKIEQVDINENRNTYLVRNVRQDAELTADLFQFVPGDATEIVDLRGGN